MYICPVYVLFSEFTFIFLNNLFLTYYSIARYHHTPLFIYNLIIKPLSCHVTTIVLTSCYLLEQMWKMTVSTLFLHLSLFSTVHYVGKILVGLGFTTAIRSGR
jgi:hypothetical protein